MHFMLGHYIPFLGIQQMRRTYRSGWVHGIVDAIMELIGGIDDK